MTTPGPVKALASTADGRHLAAAVGGDVHVWQCSSGALVAVLQGGHYQDVTRLAFTPDGSVKIQYC